VTARSGWLFAALLLGPCVLGAGPAGAAALIAVQGEPPEFRVTGAQALAGAANADLQDILQVGVDAAELQPMAGSYRLEGGVLIFRPAFPLQPGVTYKAQYRYGGETAAASHTIPKVVLAPSAEVERVFPTKDVLPQNQLKMYVHFTAPMSRGGAYQRIHIIDDASGVEVRYPFLRLAEELWDSEQKRLTVLFDPGRIKRGLVSQEELGMAIQPGRKYRLVIDQDWRDANSVPMKAGFTRTFSVGPEDRTALDPKDWRVTAPQPGTSSALTLDFPEALDQALLSRVLTVKDAAGNFVDGKVAVEREETRWSFTPSAAWRPGAYEIGVPGILEDLAGNKVYTPFDVDTQAMPNAPGPSNNYAVPFRVGAAR
jgi:hypothetical protein